MSYLEQLFNLSRKTVLVTGAAGQLGSVICDAFHQSGAHVVALDLAEPDRPLSCAAFYRLDITDKKQVGAVFGQIAQSAGALDVLVNNAGVSVFEPFEERPEESFDRVMDVNLKGTFFCIQEYVTRYDACGQEAGAVINIGSIFGVVSPDFRNYTDCDRKNSEVYGATKAGVIQMTKYFAVHLAARNIRVNAVSPGGIYNPSSPQGEDFINNYAFRCPMARMAYDSEMVGALIYLASDAASYTTGQNLVVDGGMTSW